MSYFTFLELIKTDQSEQNIPACMEHVENLVTLCDFLNDLREDFGAPIVVNSAFRTPVVNHAVGGVPRSLHLYGRAADIRPNHGKDFYYELSRLAQVIKKYEDDLTEFLIYKTFIHIAI